MDSLKILMTGAGAPGAPGIIKSYRNNGERKITVVGADMKDVVPTINMLDSYERIPSASSSDFLDEVLRICDFYHINVIQPLVTKELEIFSENISMFSAKDIKVCVSPISNLRIANDKGKLLSALVKSNISVPEFYVVDTIEDFIDASEKLGYPNKTICFKPTKANGSRGFRIIDSKVNKKEILFGQKPNSLYISYDEAINILKDGTFPQLLVMEFLPGDEYSVDMLVDHGKTLCAIPRLRQVMNGGISVDCTVVNHTDVIEYAVRIAEVLDLHGNIGIQVRRDKDDNIRILEINPRVQGTIVCCSAAGVDLPYLGIKLAMDEKICMPDVKWNTRMIRYWDECFYDSDGRPYSY